MVADLQNGPFARRLIPMPTWTGAPHPLEFDLRGRREGSRSFLPSICAAGPSCGESIGLVGESSFKDEVWVSESLGIRAQQGRSVGEDGWGTYLA